MNKTLKEKQLEFLEDTVKHYNYSNRSVANSGGCLYAPAHDGSMGCAIGRHIEDKALCRRLDDLGASSVGIPSVFRLIPQSIQDLGIEFLAQVQQLHDFSDHWGIDGITEVGLKKVHYIEKGINEGKYELEQLSA